MEIFVFFPKVEFRHVRITRKELPISLYYSNLNQCPEIPRSEMPIRIGWDFAPNRIPHSAPGQDFSKIPEGEDEGIASGNTSRSPAAPYRHEISIGEKGSPHIVF